MGLDQPFAFCWRKFGETPVDILGGNTPASGGKSVQQTSRAAAERRQQAQGQKMQQPEQGDGELAQKAGRHGCGMARTGKNSENPRGRQYIGNAMRPTTL